MSKELSKSTYCKGVQCPKILWMDDHMPDKAEESLDDAEKKNGILVGELGRSYFGDYTLVDSNADKNDRVAKTAELMDAGVENIAEASFLVDGLFCSVDILHRVGNAYDIAEIKSFGNVDENPDVYDDIAFQYYVLNKSGVEINKAYNLHANTKYERRGEIDLKEYFVLDDFTEQIEAMAPGVEKMVESIRKYIDTEDEPSKDIDICCEKPHECAYFGYCSRHIPDNSVFDISGMRLTTKLKLYHDGIITFEDIVKKKAKISDSYRRQVEYEYHKKSPYIDAEKIKEFLATLSYPLYHLDFEAFQQAVPEYDGVKPYGQIPFQYSLHIEDEDGSLDHKEFLAKEGMDPRRDLAERLCLDIPTDVCVLAYYASFEKNVIMGLAEEFPDLSEHLLAIRENIKDLIIPFKKGYYYCREMHGSSSIKDVLPALCPGDPELDYHALDGVHNGKEASAAFADMQNHTAEEIEKMRQNLLKYCGLDTLAMVKVLEKLREVCE